MPRSVEEVIRAWLPFILLLAIQTGGMMFWFGRSQQQTEDRLEQLQSSVNRNDSKLTNLDNSGTRQIPLLAYRVDQMASNVTELNKSIQKLQAQVDGVARNGKYLGGN